MTKLAIILWLVSWPVCAATVTAASCNAADFNAVVNGPTHTLAAGDTIIVPAGNCVWTTQITVTVPTASSSSVITTFQGQTTCTGSGDPAANNMACTDSTTITDALSNNNQALSINGAATGEVRITGFTFNASVTVYHGVVGIGIGNNPGFRVDHNHFTGALSGDIEIYSYGVVDHNIFYATNSDENTTRIYNGGGSDGFGHASYADSPHFGTNQFAYLEANYFYSASAAVYQLIADCSIGGRYVARFNTLGYHMVPYTHGTSGGGGSYRGCRSLEIYGNTAVWNSGNASDTNYTFMNAESGTGLVWGNNISGQKSVLNEDYSRRVPGTYAQTAPPNGWGYCGNNISGQSGTSAWDQNSNATNGYACLDQPGRGQGNLLSGSFPATCNQTTGCTTYNGAWPNQALEPWYLWGNTLNSALQTYFQSTSNAPTVMVENRDFYLQLPNLNESAAFNGTAGIGQGTLASRPTSCTTGVGYFATDQGSWNTSGNGFGNGVFYTCSATNTWTVFYTPYVYPHPLAGGTTTPPPAAPINLTVTIQ